MKPGVLAPHVVLKSDLEPVGWRARINNAGPSPYTKSGDEPWTYGYGEGGPITHSLLYPWATYENERLYRLRTGEITDD